MRALIGPGTVAVMLALIQGEVGVIPAEDSFVQALRQLCDEEGGDEVQTGCGRTGTLFANEQYGIAPDIMTLGNGLGEGVPLSALLAKRACLCFFYGVQCGTFCGDPLCCAAGMAVVHALWRRRFSGGVPLAWEPSALRFATAFAGVRSGGSAWTRLLLAIELGNDFAPDIDPRGGRNEGLLLKK